MGQIQSLTMSAARPAEQTFAAQMQSQTSAAGIELIISSLCGFPGHGTHLLTRGNEVRVLVRNLFVLFQSCLIVKLTLPNHIRVIRILRLPRTLAATQHATARDAVSLQHIAS